MNHQGHLDAIHAACTDLVRHADNVHKVLANSGIPGKLDGDDIWQAAESASQMGKYGTVITRLIDSYRESVVNCIIQEYREPVDMERAFGLLSEMRNIATDTLPINLSKYNREFMLYGMRNFASGDFIGMHWNSIEGPRDADTARWLYEQGWVESVYVDVRRLHDLAVGVKKCI